MVKRMVICCRQRATWNLAILFPKWVTFQAGVTVCPRPVVPLMSRNLCVKPSPYSSVVITFMSCIVVWFFHTQLWTVPVSCPCEFRGWVHIPHPLHSTFSVPGRFYHRLRSIRAGNFPNWIYYESVCRWRKRIANEDFSWWPPTVGDFSQSYCIVVELQPLNQLQHVGILK